MLNGAKLGGKSRFFQKIKTALLSFLIYSKKCPNFRSIGFKCPVLIFVDLIFLAKKLHIVDYIDFGTKNTKTSIFNRLDGIVILI